MGRFEVPRVEGSYFDAKGVRIHYTDEGRGPPVVLLHGFAVNADLNWRWPGIIRRLRREFRVLAMDLRGHGRSDKPRARESYGVAMATDVLHLLDALELGRAHVVGYSLGGFVALKLATLASVRLSSLGVLGAGWERPDRSVLAGALERFADEVESTGSVSPLSGGLGGGRRPSLRHTLWVRMATRFLNDGAVLASVIRSVPELAVTESALRELDLPICSIVGERDPLLESARALHARVHGATHIVVRRADHVQAPLRRELARGLAEFLRKASANP
jgi:pimeloyl-ACP methyl ester carboxylesterase